MLAAVAVELLVQALVEVLALEPDNAAALESSEVSIHALRSELAEWRTYLRQ